VREFSDYLKRHLITSGLRTQMALAAAIGMDYGQLNKIFTGKTQRPEIETLNKIAPAIKRPIAEVMTAAGYPAPVEDELPVSLIQLSLSDPDESFDPEAIVAYVESRPGMHFQDRLRQRREALPRAAYVRLCISLFRAWSSNSDLALTASELMLSQ